MGSSRGCITAAVSVDVRSENPSYGRRNETVVPTDAATRLTVRALQPLVGGLTVLGAAPFQILRAAGIQPDILHDPDTTISAEDVGSFWARAVEATGDQMLGLHIAEAAPIETFDVHAYALLSSRTLRAAYRRASRYQRLIHEGTRLDFDEGPQYGTLVHSLGGRPVARQSAEFLATAWVRIGRLVLEQEWLPRAVYFAHQASPSTLEYDRFFGAPVHFEAGQTALEVENDTLDQVSAAPDDRLAAILDQHVGTLLASRPPPRPSLSDQVLGLLVDELQDGSVDARLIARRLHMSERSLRRGLSGEGTSYRELRDRLRLERSLALLQGGRCSIAEIAYLLGFSEVSAFHRAFKRWTGRTPAEARAKPR